MPDDSAPFADALARGVSRAITSAHADTAAHDPTHADTDCYICALPYSDPHADDDPAADTAY